MDLIGYLRKHHGFRSNNWAEAKHAAKQLLKDLKMPLDIYSPLVSGGDLPAAEIESTLKWFSNLNTDSEKDFDTMSTTRDTTVAEALHTAAYSVWGQPSGNTRGFGGPNVKAPSARYNEKRYVGHHKRTGKEVFHEGEVVTLPSEKNHALTGVYFRHLMLRRGADIRPLDEHERELLKEIYNDHDWVGDVGGKYCPGAKLEAIFGRKGTDLINDSTSGGEYLVPYFFDTDIVTFPLLNSELFPFVTVKDLTWSNAVHTASLATPTMAWSGSEGSAAAIDLATTDGLVASITASVFNVAAAISIGKDFLSDSPVNVGQELDTLFGQRYAAELDKVIAVGDGSTQPEGLSHAAGTVAVTAKNGSAGPWTVTDVENLIGGLPKQYRGNKNPSVCYVMNDTQWFNLRGISVSSTDQRRIFGYDYESYQLTGRDVRINNDLPETFVAFLQLALYRMYRRMGLKIETSDQGKTLMTNNEILIVARGRFAGKLVNGAGCATMTGAPKTH